MTSGSQSSRALANDEMITIKVHDKSYNVQRAVLVKASKWFDKALKGSFREGKELVLRFPGTTTIVVEYFLYYLMCDCNPFATKIESNNVSTTQLTAV